jgi:hypothetical protein
VPGRINGTVQSVASSVGSIVANVAFAAAQTVNVDMIVYAETPSVLELDKLSAATIMQLPHYQPIKLTHY